MIDNLNAEVPADEIRASSNIAIPAPVYASFAPTKPSRLTTKTPAYCAVLLRKTAKSAHAGKQELAPHTNGSLLSRLNAPATLPC